MSLYSPTGLRLACHKNDMEQVTGILKAPRHCWEGELDDGLVGAVENSNRPLIQLLRSKGARFNRASFNRLCTKADLGVYQDVFGPAGLDINTTESGGECILWYVALSRKWIRRSDDSLHRLTVRRIDVMEWLLARGADPNLVGERGASPLITAIVGGLCDSVDVLLAHGAVLEEGALHKALWATTRESADLGIVKHLISKGANVNEVAVLRTGRPMLARPTQRKRGTPLQFASKLGLTEAAQVLLDAGADPDVAVGGKIPWQLAEPERHPKVYELLRSVAY